MHSSLSVLPCTGRTLLDRIPNYGWDFNRGIKTYSVLKTHEPKASCVLRTLHINADVFPETKSRIHGQETPP